jgi:hypothetical protein
VHPGNPCPGGDDDLDCSESCDEAAAACTAPDPTGSACRDADPCTFGETCNASGLCAGGEAIDCVDDDPCTADTCQDEEPHCLHVPILHCPPTTTLEDFPCGDANHDGSRTAGDALLVLKSAVGGFFCSERPCLCDANGNGKLTAADALAVLRVAVGLPQTLACPC